MTTTDRPGDDTLREVRELATRGTEIGARLNGLDTAVQAARGRLDEALIADVQGAVDRAAGRLRLSAKHTVIGIAGATGSGKSSTYNALVGLELSSIGVRRPTTSWASACVWGSEEAQELLQWLGIPPRHQTMRDSLLDARHDGRSMEGVVLLDLPDHDSTEVAHHLEVDRLVELADLLIWVLDPQKYADAALHERYLAPYRTHSDVMLVLLNQIDLIPEAERPSLVADVRRLLADDGLPDVKVLPVSAQQGIGMDELRQVVEQRVSAKRSATVRVEADVRAAAGRLYDDGTPRELNHEEIHRLEDAVAEAAGVESVAATVGRWTSARAVRATQWPPLALGRLFDRDPGKHLAVDLGDDLSHVGGSGSVEAAPQVAPVSRELVDAAVRDLTEDASRGLPGQWAESVARAGSDAVASTTVKLGAGLAGVDLGVNRLPGWVRGVQAVQWLLLAVTLLSAVWWVGSAVTGEVPRLGALPLPAVLLVLGVVAGVVLGLVCFGVLRGVARARAAEVEDQLRDVIADVVSSGVVRPVGQELSAYASFKVGLTAALS